MGKVFANDPGDLGSIPGRVIPKILKMVLDTSLFNTQQYKVCIKGKVDQSRERSSAIPYTSVWLLLKREPSGRYRLQLLNLSFKKFFDSYSMKHTMESLKRIRIIWYVSGVSKKFDILNLITWPILVQMISNFISMCKNNSKFYF